jgi:L-glyceraldehyde 3-phosphate reductase
MKYKRCGKSGIQMSQIALGMWQNFSANDIYANSREMILGAFDRGVTYFDLANNYGPPPGSAEETFGKIMSDDLKLYRDEMLVATKAGYTMWPGPYGDWGSKKYLVTSLDQSLKRMGMDYVDIFYHHRPDPNTPMEETMDALAGILRSGKALYAAISNYKAEDTKRACTIAKSMGFRLLVHQPSYSMFNRWVENGLYDTLAEEEMGAVTFSSLAQGLLTDKYFNGIPADSRAGGPSIYLRPESVTNEKVEKAKQLNVIATQRGQSLAQMAVAWVLRMPQTTSVIIGASRLSQIDENIKALSNLAFSEEELKAIDDILIK